MAVTFGVVGTQSVGTNNVTPSYPTGISASTSHLYMFVGSGHASDLTPDTPSGWSLIVTRSGGGGVYGLDAGPRRVTVFKKNTVTGSESGTVTVGMATDGEMRAQIVRFEAAAGHRITEQTSTAEDATSGTAWSVTSDPLTLAPGQNVSYAWCSVPDGATESSRSFTASGITFSARNSAAGNNITSGNDLRFVHDTYDVNSGSGTVAITASHTSSASASGAAAWIVMTEVARVRDMIGAGFIPWARA